MSTRKCIYTGKNARSKSTVIPKELLGDNTANWAVYSPCDSDYAAYKAHTVPTELEMQANETFHFLELARLRVVFYEQKLAQIQSQILSTYKEPTPNAITESIKTKEKQIETMVIEKEIIEEINKDIETILNNKRKLWE